MKPHEEWLFKADHDLKSTKILLGSEEPLLDVAIYHCQQCAEKALKAYMSFCRQEIPKIHNLKSLVEECIILNEVFQEILDDCIYLSPYATLYRYPEGDLMPDRQEVIDALKTASMILFFVIEKISATGLNK